MPSLTPLTLMALAYVQQATPVVQAAVSSEEAANLKTTLTPVDAQRAGNEDGSIPPWAGDYPVHASYKFASFLDLFAMRRTF